MAFRNPCCVNQWWQWKVTVYKHTVHFPLVSTTHYLKNVSNVSTCLYYLFPEISNTLQDKRNEQTIEIWDMFPKTSSFTFLDIKGPVCIGLSDIITWAGAKWYILLSSVNPPVLIGLSSENKNSMGKRCFLTMQDSK